MAVFPHSEDQEIEGGTGDLRVVFRDGDGAVWTVRLHGMNCVGSNPIPKGSKKGVFREAEVAVLVVGRNAPLIAEEEFHPVPSRRVVGGELSETLVDGNRGRSTSKAKTKGSVAGRFESVANRADGELDKLPLTTSDEYALSRGIHCGPSSFLLRDRTLEDKSLDGLPRGIKEGRRPVDGDD